jgi:acyl-ACP thioesterase
MIKEELLFNNINTEIELDNIIYKVCIFDDNNFEIIPWYEITETNLKYNQLVYLGENITTDNEK